jgi:Zn-dependent protease with chaperone function
MATPETVLTTWAPAERESFFRAIERHRQAAWRVRVVSGFANAVVALIVAVLMAPLFYAVICLTLDLINLLIPMPNLVPRIANLIDTAVNNPKQLHWYQPLVLLSWAAAPGLLWMIGVIRMLRRMLNVASLADAASLQARPPNREVLAEQRFSNVIDEMAIAANLPPPAVLITQRQMLNAAVLGISAGTASIVISESLLATLSRQEMQGVAAHLMGSIADGDLPIGQSAAVSASLFGLMGSFSNLLVDEKAFQHLWGLFTALWKPQSATAQPLLRRFADPFAPEAQPARKTKTGPTNTEYDWRTAVRLPLAGPVVIAGFFGGFVSTFLLKPLLALAWRQRKYMADAVAVRLTRDPDALAGALGKLGSGEAFAPWMAHLSVVNPSSQKGMMGSFVPMFPSSERRLRELSRLGANVAAPPPRKVPLKIWLIAAPLGTLVVVLMTIVAVLLCYVSIPLSALFTGIPFGLIHMLLRAIGHH